MIVVGSANSSDSVPGGVEVALEAGAKASYRMDDVSEMREE